jgi:hypothetical protein
MPSCLAMSASRATACASGYAGRPQRCLERVLSGYPATRLARCLCSIGITAVGDVHDRHRTGLIVNPVDDPVGATACAEPVIHRRKQSFPDPGGVRQHRAGYELVGGCRNSHGKSLAQGTADG